MTARIAVSGSPGEIRAVLIEAGRVVDYAITRPGAPDGVGDLHRGRVTALAPGLGGVFIKIDSAGAGEDGFLPDTAGAKGVTEGALLGVRVSRAAQGRKGKRLTGSLDDAERALAAEGPVRLIRRGPCAALRLAALAPNAPVATDDASLLISLKASLGDRASFLAPAFDEALEERLAALEEPNVMLAPGVAGCITPTPALVAIDLDSSGARSADAANRAALPALALEIRLRNLCGAILVDFAGLSPKRRRALGPALAEALALDPLAPGLLGFTALGLAEIVRARVHPPLHELMAGAHAAGLRAVRRLVRDVAADPSRRVVLRATRSILAALSTDRTALAGVASKTGRALVMREDASAGPSGWSVEIDHG